MQPAAVEATPPPRRAGWRAKLALLASTMLLLLLLDFAAARTYRAVRGHPWPAGNPERTYRIPADPYHHDLLANVSTDARWGVYYPFRTNSLGFRDASVREVELEPLGRRIVFLGDSFSEGIGFPYEKTFVGQVAAALAPTGVEVLNASVSSYCPAIYYRKAKYLLEEKGLRFHELIVPIDVSDAHDEAVFLELEDDVVRSRGLVSRAAEVLKTNSIVLWTILDGIHGRFKAEGTVPGLLPPPPSRLDLERKSDAEIEAVLKRPPWMRTRRGNWPHDERYYREFGEKGEKLMVKHMDMLLALLRKRGIALRVVVYPWPDQIVAGDPDCRHVRLWREWCTRNAVPFIDALPKFEVGSSWRRRAETIEACYIPGDSHYNEEGNRRVAEAILDGLKGAPDR